ncbi:MAG TPA: TraR/DksA C4-type zinc finger protein [Candidatus Saccharimonadales bacterium]|nr:TraR/DksA C4-type zinc finger protein [Candidatus Saccharimonadales bacterium]
MINIKQLTGKIEEQRKAITSRLSRLRREDPFSTTDRSLIVEPATDAAALSGHEQTMVLEGRLQSDLKEIEAALKKIKKGTYGKCERCGKPIEAARLEAKPSAIYCLKDESEIEKKRG